MSINIALHKPACQSSYSKWSKPGESSRAVDGLKTSDFSFHTNIEEQAWWQVDLENVYPLDSIVIYNRGVQGSELSERAKSAEIFISETGMEWKLIYAGGQSFGGYQDNKPLSVTCENESARFVRVQLHERNYLHLVQVEVYSCDRTPNLRQLGIQYGTDKVTHGFCNIYQQEFTQIRTHVTKILEIGGFFGASLCMWRDWFPHAVVHGADHFTGYQGNGRVFAHADKFFKEVAAGQHSRIVLHQLDQSRPEDLKHFSVQHLHGSFDIVLDDVSHLMRDQQQTLAKLFCLVKPSGYFVIEDLHSSLLPDYDVAPDGSNSTLRMIEQAIAGHGWKSEYMSTEEEEFLNRAVDITHTRITGSSNSLTCIMRRRSDVLSIKSTNIMPGSIALINYATLDQLNQFRQQQHIKWAKQWIAEAASTPESGIDKIDLICFGPDLLDDQFSQQNKEILTHKRGGGYWLWKPYLIASMLAASNAEFIIYCDCGSTIVKPMNTVFEALRNSGAAVMAFDLTSNGWYEKDWTKGQVFRALDATCPEITETGQLAGTVSVWRVCETSRNLVSEWLTLMQNPDFVTDSPNSDEGGDYPGFREHRHDQSVFSILLKKAMAKSSQGKEIVITRDFKTWAGHHHIA